MSFSVAENIALVREVAARACWTCGSRPARLGFLTCDECERVTGALRQTPGTLAYAIAHAEREVAGPNLEELVDAHGLRCTLCGRTWTVPAESSDVQLATVGEWFEQHRCKETT